MRPLTRSLLVLLGLLLAAFVSMGQQMAQTQDAVVQAVLFYSPTCPHCHKVMTEDLPPLFDQYGDQLTIMAFSTADDTGQQLYLSAIDRYSIPQERRGVPTLIIGDNVLVGDMEIPALLPGLIEQFLAQGGVGWPDIPGLAEAIGETQSTGSADATSDTASQATGMFSRFALDPAGNTLAVLVLGGMLASVGLVAARSNLQRRPRGRRARRAEREAPLLDNSRFWWVMGLSLLGLVVAIYLSYVEMTQVEAICGPVGDCNTVQQSEFARIGGLLPVGLLGALGYVTMLFALISTRSPVARSRKRAMAALFVMAALGTLFSIYLTFLEPFVIGATCAWCLTSAITMTLIFLISAGPGMAALRGPTTRRLT